MWKQPARVPFFSPENNRRSVEIRSDFVYNAWLFQRREKSFPDFVVEDWKYLCPLPYCHLMPAGFLSHTDHALLHTHKSIMGDGVSMMYKNRNPWLHVCAYVKGGWWSWLGAPHKWNITNDYNVTMYYCRLSDMADHTTCVFKCIARSVFVIHISDRPCRIQCKVAQCKLLLQIKIQ